MLFLALLQVTLMPHLAIAHVQADLVLAAVVSWALLRGATDGAIWGFVGGIALDFLSGAPFGTHTFVMTIVGIVAGLCAALIPRERSLLLPAVAVLCTIIQQGAYVWLLRAAGWPLQWPSVLVAVVIPAAVLNLLLTVLFYPLVGLLQSQEARGKLSW